MAAVVILKPSPFWAGLKIPVRAARVAEIAFAEENPVLQAASWAKGRQSALRLSQILSRHA
jgi:hypothetical protein